jgi:hypothetical protein
MRQPLQRRLRLALTAATRPTYLVLAALLAVGFFLRLRHNDSGLPYTYNFDEETHFTSRAVEMVDQSTLDPGYYENPSNFTYLVYALLRFRYGDLPLIGRIDDLSLPTVPLQFVFDPAPIWLTARSLAAVLGILGVLGVFYVGRRMFGAWEGLVAAAVMSFAFLPVTYSRIAVTDAGTLLPVALAIYGAVMAYERGSLQWYLLAGVATGVAIGFKYTAGLVVLPLLVAAALRLLEGDRRVVENVVASLIAMSVVFAVTNPFFFIKFKEVGYDLVNQAEAAGGTKKFGQEQSSGLVYYLDSLRWGLGWVPALAALAGAIVLYRLNRVRALLLLVFPVALFLYMSIQSRYFGRWLLPVYPVLALLCGLVLVRLARMARVPEPAQAAILALLTAVVLAQPVAADIRTTEVLSREDTRQEARDFLTREFGPRLRIIIEPAVPDLYYQRVQNGASYRLRPIACSGFEKASVESPVTSRDCLPTDQLEFVNNYARDIRRAASTVEVRGMTAYAKTLRPETIDSFRANGFCLVMTMSLVRGRAENADDPQALAYYRRLERESIPIFHASPYDPGADPPDFHFDLSYNHYPTAFRRPGPEITIYRLSGCKQRRRAVELAPRGTDGLEKGVATSFQGFDGDRGRR